MSWLSLTVPYENKSTQLQRLFYIKRREIMHRYYLFLCIAFLCSVANAQWGSALNFNSSSQYAHLGAPVDTITDNLTMEAWVKWTGSTSQLQPIVFNGGADTCGYG